MALEQKLSLKLSQRLVMTPSLQQAIKLLQMSKLELEEVLTQEMVENPLLEEEQEETAAPEETREAAAEETAAAPSPSPTPESEQPKERDSFEEIDFDTYFEDYLESAYNPRQYEESEAVPLENTLSSPPGLQEYLGWQLSMSETSAPVREIATYLIGNIDEDGYLRVSREEIRAAGFLEDADTEAALVLVRSFDPPGICARDLPDCLLLQIRALGIDNPLIDRIITEHWPEFLNRQFASLARTLGVGMFQLQAVVEIIKNLEPKP
ncbi:MAG TPA: RNA polymerase sigma-54 factor, partial [Thermoanaerobaculia bacterium]